MLLDIYVPPSTVAALLKRYDNTVHFDLMQVLAGRNPFSGKIEAKKLDFYLRRFGLGSKSDGWDGSMVYPAFKEGRHQEILEYCKRDVEMTAALFERVMPWVTTKSLSAAEGGKS
jgi:predicted PolB exonuclease-like 3'-5' exonuclease